MATVRELVAKLGFSIDTSGADKFNRAISGVRTSLNALATGKALQAATNIEESFLRSQRIIELIAGEKGLGGLNDALKNASKTASDASIAEAYRATLETTTDPEFARRITKFAGIIADIRGESIQEAAQGLASGAFGDLKALQQIGAITQQQAEFIGRVGLSTAEGKRRLLAALDAASPRLLKAQAQALKTAGTQWEALTANISNMGLAIGKFLNPLIGELLGLFNAIFEAWQKSPLFQGVTKVLAIGGALAVVAGILSGIVSAMKLLLFFVSPLFIKFFLIAAALTAVALLIEDAFFSGKDFKDSYLGKGLIWLADRLWMISFPLQLIADTIRILFGTDLKDTVLGRGLLWMQSILQKGADKLSKSMGLDTPEGQQRMAAVQASNEGGLGRFLGGLYTPPGERQQATGGGQVTDNRKLELTIHAQTDNPYSLAKVVQRGIDQSSFGQALSMTKASIASRNNMSLGANER